MVIEALKDLPNIRETQGEDEGEVEPPSVLKLKRTISHDYLSG
jgi:hypothetical protein